jgi:hypothetical protein
MDSKVAQMVQKSYDYYKGNTNLDVKGYNLVAKSSSGLIYERPQTKIRIYAFRGTQNQEDVSSFPSLASNTFSSSTRYQKDKEFVKQHPAPEGYKTIGAGHSLGGAIIDQLLADGLIQTGISFNPAVELNKLDNTGNKRIYNRNDFLYKLIGQFASNTHIVNNDLFSRIEGTLRYFDILKSLYEHNNKQFIEKEKLSKEDVVKIEPKESNSYLIQSVVLDKEKFPTLEKAKEWASAHKYKTDKHDETLNEWRFRQVSPSIFTGGIYTAKTVKLDDIGNLIIAYKS